jgi:dTDP-glucose pyrophosphorylase
MRGFGKYCSLPVEKMQEASAAAWKRKGFWFEASKYIYQEGEGGIAEALGLAEDFADGDQICVILGDNIIENDIRNAAEAFKIQKHGAKILVKEVTNDLVAFRPSKI